MARFVIFAGDGMDMLDLADIHIDHPMLDATFCGITMDGDTKTAGTCYLVPNKKVTCPHCIAMIAHVRGVRIK